MKKDVALVLKKKGYRFSKVREGIVTILGGACEGYSAPDILVRLAKKGIAANKTTVYRELAMLEKEGIVKVLHFGENKKRYELTCDNHHHHVICISCYTVREVVMDGDLERREKDIEKKQGFTILHHSLEFYGVCSKCSKK